ncbi:MULTISPECIES: hypothetical protein [Microbacterium]|uniref:hypothetical protein n=1 Tax=Microbacterium TaxID=33882 RepID=UPI0025E4106F|nr:MULTISPECIES: hypothetical protein [Microbacterium]
MRSPRLERFALGAVLALGAVALAGCASGSTPSSAIPTSSSNPTPGPSATSEPTAAPTPTPSPSSAEFGEFTADELVTICIDATRSGFAGDVQFDSASSRIEHRNVSPDWLVLVPAQTAGFEGEAQCTIGGTPSSPDIGLSSASIERLPEDQIQKLIDGKNEGGDR